MPPTEGSDFVRRLGRAALVGSFPFFFSGRSAVGELFPSVGRVETGARGIRAAVASQFNPLTRGPAGLIQVPILEEIAGNALLDRLGQGGPIPDLIRRLRR